MTAIENALIKVNANYSTARDRGLALKAAGFGSAFIAPSDGLNQLSQFQNQGANRQRYSMYRGWVHSAVHALGSEGGSQAVHIGKPKKTGKPGKTTKSVSFTEWSLKNASKELEIIEGHPLQKILDRPNVIQDRWQFVYSFVANLCLTGWSFVVRGGDDKNPEFYSLPTTWIEPDHTKGLFAEYRIRNPNNPSAGVTEPIDGKYVKFTYFPNPSDPLAALSLTQAQQMGIKIDDHIQSSQNLFFENGVFPSVIVTVGNNPHPDVPGGIAPRLSAPQRRQVYAAIRKVMGGVANYGNPAILDGLIGKIERLSATQNEMGWEKSEQSVRTRILSAFGVHPFILGEQMPGSYAQAYIVRDIFCRRVNTFLSMLSNMMTAFVEDQGLTIWYEDAKAVDPSADHQLWQQARTRGDVSQDEFRNWMGLPPDKDRNQQQIAPSAIQAVGALAAQATAGAITPEQAQAILESAGITVDAAKKIAGEGKPEAPAGGESGAFPEEDLLSQTGGNLEEAFKRLEFFSEKVALEQVNHELLEVLEAVG